MFQHKGPSAFHFSTFLDKILCKFIKTKHLYLLRSCYSQEPWYWEFSGTQETCSLISKSMRSWDISLGWENSKSQPGLHSMPNRYWCWGAGEKASTMTWVAAPIPTQSMNIRFTETLSQKWRSGTIGGIIQHYRLGRTCFCTHMHTHVHVHTETRNHWCGGLISF